MRAVEHTPLIRVAVPWAPDPLAMVCRPFYAHRDGEPGCEFSNLYPAPVAIDTERGLAGMGPDETFLFNRDGIVLFPSTENAFQAAKALYPVHDHFVRTLSPVDAARAGQGRLAMNADQRRLYQSLGGIPFQKKGAKRRKYVFSASGRFALRPGWEALKREVMFLALEAKFDQHPGLWAGALEAETPTFFIEHTRNDAQWGDGRDGMGTNFLGKLLTLLLCSRRESCLLPRTNDKYTWWMLRPNIEVCSAFYETLQRKLAPSDPALERGGNPE